MPGCLESVKMILSERNLKAAIITCGTGVQVCIHETAESHEEVCHYKGRTHL
jgi:hypothetical protein